MARSHCRFIFSFQAAFTLHLQNVIRQPENIIARIIRAFPVSGGLKVSLLECLQPSIIAQRY
ncbi:hypothetical protein [Kingella oralis]|uniref:hypothetical protein n=1 Tax=Kingella oralis TaxID=505 RepID=UPI002D806FC0|nr:hypothetical protein [Kingella oralis]